MKKAGILALFVICLSLLLIALPAWAQEARDITKQCIITTKVGKATLKNALDGSYKTWFSSGTTLNSSVNVVLPAGEEADGLYIKWVDYSVAIRIQVETNGKYETIAVCDTPYLSSYIPLPEGVTAFHFLQAEKARGRMNIAEMRIFSRGDLPDYVQRWNEPCQKADLLVISTHPDDELIFLGGTIPYYAGELGKAVQVAYVVPAMPERRLELLDGLWHCGVRNYPAFGKFKDRFSTKLTVMQQSWGKKRLDNFIVRLYREFRPDVVVSQDLNGEYGHGGHKAVADAAARAVGLAAKADYDTDSAKSHGVWQVSKLYLHLYPEGQVRMDWRMPLNAFGGKTAFDIASEAFQFHVSQQKGLYFVEDFGPYDNAIFGLYVSSVGEDLVKKDFFENIQ